MGDRAFGLHVDQLAAARVLIVRLVADDRSLRFGSMNRAAADDRPASSGDAQFRNGHAYRHA
jgi:hypothetical protein